MKKLLTVLLTVLIAFTTLTINVAANETEVPEEEIVETVATEEEAVEETPSEEVVEEPVEEVKEEIELPEVVEEEIANELPAELLEEPVKAEANYTIDKTFTVPENPNADQVVYKFGGDYFDYNLLKGNSDNCSFDRNTNIFTIKKSAKAGDSFEFSLKIDEGWMWEVINTYYFRVEVKEAETYKLVTSINDLSEGDEVILVSGNQPNKTYYVYGDSYYTKKNSYLYYEEVSTDANNEIRVVEDAFKEVCRNDKIDRGYVFSVKNLKDGKFNLASAFELKDDKVENYINIDNTSYYDLNIIKSGSNKLLFNLKNSSANLQATYSTKTYDVKADGDHWFYIYNTSGSNVYLYKKVVAAKKITVTFDAQNETANTTKEYTEGETYGTLPTPTYGDKYFLGWFKADGTTQVKDTDTVEEITLYAHWATKVTVPTAKDNLIYTGEPQDGLNGYNEDYMEMAEVFNNFIKRTDAGTYYAHLDVKDGYVWDLGVDGVSVETQTIEWTIAPMTIEVVTELSHKLTPVEKAKHYIPAISFKDKDGKVADEVVTGLVSSSYKETYCVGTVTDDEAEWKDASILNQPGEYTLRIEVGNNNFVFGYREVKAVKVANDANELSPVRKAYIHITLTDKTKVTPVLVNDPLVYNGNDQKGNLKIDGDGDGVEDTIATVAYITTPGRYGERPIRQVVNAGEYKAYLKLNNSEEYEWSEETSKYISREDGNVYAIVPFVVSKKEIDYRKDIKDLVKTDLVYNGDDQAPIARRALPLGVSYADNAAWFLGYDNYATDADDYVALLALDADNCVWSNDTKTVEWFGNEYAVVSWSIAKKDATIHVGDASKTYGQIDPNFNREVEVTGEDFVGREFNRLIRPTITIFAEKESDNAGEYPISVRYDERVAHNYEITIDKGTYTINKAKLTAYIEPNTFEYTGYVIEPEVLFDGFVGYEALEDREFVPIKGIDYRVVYNSGLFANSIDAGTKHAYVRLTSEKLMRNYELVGGVSSLIPELLGYEDITYVITPKKVHVKWIDTYHVYDGNTHSPDLVFEGICEPDVDHVYPIQIDLPLGEIPEDKDELKTMFDKAQKSNDALIRFRNAGEYCSFALITGTKASNYYFVGQNEGDIWNDDVDPWFHRIAFTDFTIDQRELKVVWSDKVKFSKKSYAQGPEILDLEVVNDEGDAIVDWDKEYFTGENIVYVDYEEGHGKQTSVGKYTAKAKVYTKDFTGLLHPTSNYKLVNDSIDFKIYRKSNEDTTPVKTGVDR